MTRFNTRAVVTGRSPLGESDCFADFISPSRGRVSAIVKGAYRSQRRFMGGFEPPSIMEVGFMTTSSADRVLVEHADIAEPFAVLRSSPLRLARASVLIETGLLTVPMYQRSQEAYRLLETGLYLLQQAPDSDRWPLVYAFRLLSLAGLKPGLDCCVGCGREPGKRSVSFCPAEGGVVCRRCRKEGMSDRDMCKLSVDTLRTLRMIMEAPENRLARFDFTRRTMTQAEEALFSFSAHQLGSHLRSLEFMRKMKVA